jgi:competence protein ComEC
MVERGKGGRARTWPEMSAAWARRAFPWPALPWAGLIGHRLRAWASADVAPGRLIPWLAVAYGFGIVLYFTADREPAWWAGLAAASAGAAIAFLTRARPLAFPVALGITAIASGFATGTLRGVHVAHPVLAYPVSGAEISGVVEVREDRERSDRIVIRVQKIDAPRLDIKPERVRLSVRKGTAPPVGSSVTLKARLNPPLQPLRPGGYDFARDLYFHGIGASGFVLGRITTHPDSGATTLWLRYASAIATLRDGIDARIRAVLSGDRASIASALITGKRDAISTPVNDAMYVSSLAHVLSISGYHMAIVAGVVFFAIRAGLALIPSLANRRPIKKWAAFAAIVAAAFYLLLSGAEVATQRSFIMTSVVLIGVMLDRPALTVRTIAVAALIVLLFHPEAIVHPSFQMSFAATLALVAGYERGLPWFSNVPDTSLGARIALWGGREIAGLVIVSILAGLATMPYAAFHFHRLAPYGALANLLAMPIVSAWVMPAGILAMLALPFGFDGIFWRIMGDGIDWMIAVALWVASLPGAVGRISAFGVGPLLLGSAGLVLLCLLRSPLRWAGTAVAVPACIWVALTPVPDVYIAHDGQIVAVRNAQGALSVVKARNDDFTVKEWLAADADKREPRDGTLGEGTACDGSGCIARLPDGAPVALSKHPASLEEDCLRAAIVVTPRSAPTGCGALVIDRDVSRARGAIAIYRSGGSFEIVRARPQGQDRPWARATADAATRQPVRPSSRDATPRAEDMEPDD